MTNTLKDLANFKTSTYKFSDPDSWKEEREFFDEEAELYDIANLIKVMVLHNATKPEIIRILKHLMVIKDTKKYHLNWSKSEEDSNIAQLKEKYPAYESYRYYDIVDPDYGHD